MPRHRGRGSVEGQRPDGRQLHPLHRQRRLRLERRLAAQDRREAGRSRGDAADARHLRRHHRPSRQGHAGGAADPGGAALDHPALCRSAEPRQPAPAAAADGPDRRAAGHGAAVHGQLRQRRGDRGPHRTDRSGGAGLAARRHGPGRHHLSARAGGGPDRGICGRRLQPSGPGGPDRPRLPGGRRPGPAAPAVARRRRRALGSRPGRAGLGRRAVAAGRRRRVGRPAVVPGQLGADDRGGGVLRGAGGAARHGGGRCVAPGWNGAAGVRAARVHGGRVAGHGLRRVRVLDLPLPHGAGGQRRRGRVRPQVGRRSRLHPLPQRPRERPASSRPTSRSTCCSPSVAPWVRSATR